MVFIHGVGLDHKIWQYLLEDLSGIRTLAYDLLGHGQTRQTLNRQSSEPFNVQLHQLLSNLEIPEVVLVGFSLGSLVAAHYAASHSQNVKALVLISSVYQRSSAEREAIAVRVRQAKNGGWDGLRTAALERWFSPEFLEANPCVREEILTRLKDNAPSSFLASYELLANSDDHEPDYQNISAPTLILTGDGDQGSTPQMTVEMRKVIPNARSSILENAKHLCIIENHSAISAQIKEFLTEKVR